MRPEVGLKIGRYTLTSHVGNGPTSMVFAANDADTGQTVAIKFLARARAFDAYHRNDLQQQLNALAALKHPDIVLPMDSGQWRQQVYLVLPYAPNGNLAQRVQTHGPIDYSTVRELVTLLADVLTMGHGAGVVHGNLKPTNVLFDAENRPKLTDFNPSAHFGNWLSPEQQDRRSATARTDVFGLGQLTYFALTGTRPFGTSVSGQNTQIRTSVRMQNNLDSLLFKVLAQQPHARFASCVEFASALPNQLEKTVTHSFFGRIRSKFLG